MLIIIISVLLGAALVLGLYFGYKFQRRAKPDALLIMQQQIDGLRQQLGDSLNANTQVLNQQLGELNSRINLSLGNITSQMITSQKNVGDRLDTAASVVGDVQKNLTSLMDATQRVFEVGKDISSLQEILKAPKLRGGLGEFFLGDLLLQVLPASHVLLQHKFKNGDTVDAAIRLASGLVSVDSKFPLENFRRIMSGTNEDEKKQARRKFITDVKKHIDAIAQKYILTDEGTLDFALMYIPAENVYYEVIIKDENDNESLNLYALSRKVIPVSPNSLYSYLQTVAVGLKGMKVAENVRNILKQLKRLEQDIVKFKEDYDILGRHVVNLKNKYDDADKRINDFEAKLSRLCQFDEKNEFIDNDSQQS